MHFRDTEYFFCWELCKLFCTCNILGVACSILWLLRLWSSGLWHCAILWASTNILKEKSSHNSTFFQKITMYRWKSLLAVSVPLTILMINQYASFIIAIFCQFLPISIYLPLSLVVMTILLVTLLYNQAYFWTYTQHLEDGHSILARTISMHPQNYNWKSRTWTNTAMKTIEPI